MLAAIRVPAPIRSWSDRWVARAWSHVPSALRPLDTSRFHFGRPDTASVAVIRTEQRRSPSGGSWSVAIRFRPATSWSQSVAGMCPRVRRPDAVNRAPHFSARES